MGKEKKPAPDTIYRGTKTLPDSVYEGELVNDLRHGQGSCRWTNGDIYEGAWRADKRNGYGTLRLAETKDRYEGMWKDGKADGYGVMAWAAGTRYEGMWKENKRSGFGRFFYPDGVIYEGQWLENKRHGNGIMLWPDGSVYHGRFADDKIEGSGRYFPAESAVDKVWFMTAVADFPAVAMKELRRRKLVASGAGSPLLGHDGIPINMEGLRREAVRHMLQQHVGDQEDATRYLAALQERGYDNIVALKYRVRSEADLRMLGITKPVHAKKLMQALSETPESAIMPPSHPLLHHYLFSLFEYDDIENERLVSYVTALNEQLGLTMTEELALVDEADLERLALLEGHKTALIYCKRNLNRKGHKPISPMPRMVEAPPRAPEPEPAPLSPPPPPPISEQEQNKAVVVGELREALMAMKSRQRRSSSIQGLADAGAGGDGIAPAIPPLKATNKTGAGGPGGWC